MLNLKLIVNCGPCEAYIGKCLDSIKRQTYAHWKAYLAVDPHGDRTFDIVNTYTRRDCWLTYGSWSNDADRPQ